MRLICTFYCTKTWKEKLISRVVSHAPDTVPSDQVGVQTHVITSTETQTQYPDLDMSNKNYSQYNIKSCTVKLTDVLHFNDNEQHSNISKFNSRYNCKTCDMLITCTCFTSSLTNKTYNTRSHDDLDCKSSNLVYGIECTLCGLIYVGETKSRLMNELTSVNDIHNQQIVYQHFNQIDHTGNSI